MMGNDDAMGKLKAYLRKAGIDQVDDCGDDAAVIALTIRVMEAMTKAYATVVEMLDAMAGMSEGGKEGGAKAKGGKGR